MATADWDESKTWDVDVGAKYEPILPQPEKTTIVVSATATLVMVFSSSLSVMEFYFLKKFPIPYGKNISNCSNACPHRNIHTSCSTQLSTSSPSVLAGFWGQFVDNRLHPLLGHLRQCSDHGSCWHREIHFYDQAP